MTWLYTPPPPPICADSLSALASEGSSSASTSPSADIELFVTSNGKLTRRLRSWRGWSTKPWIERLSGTILPPSTASRGVALWISSLRATPASRFLRPDGGAARLIPATFGPTSDASSIRSAPGLFTSKTCPAISRSGIPSCADSWKRWVSALQRESTQRLKLAGASFANGCSSWPSITAANGQGNDYTRDRGEKGSERLTLEGLAKLWPTTRAGDGVSGLQIKDGKRGLSLITATKLWPVVTARDYRVPASPTAQERAHHWPEKGCLSSLQDLLITLDGWTSCQKSRRLSPLFDEMLMGWPIGWTDCVQPVTGWSRWLRLSRFALSQLVSALTLATAA